MCATDIVSSGWAKISQGSHICSIYRDDDEKISPVVPFFQHGFDCREKCLYIYESDPPRRLYTEFDHKQSYPLDFRSVRQMEILPYDEAYTKDTAFQADTVIESFRQSVDSSLIQGYSGLRVAAEMNWVLSSGTPIDKYLVYESKLNDFFPGKNLIGICQFDERLFSQEFLIDMILTHPYVMIHGKLYENKYFYTNPNYASDSFKQMTADNYDMILSIFADEQPLL